MSDRYFVDTNILVYTQDLSAGKKCLQAQQLTLDLWNSRQGIISTQVLQEFYVALRRRLAIPKSHSDAQKILQDYFEWEVIVNDRESITRAIELERVYQISFWDALMLQAAERAGAATVYSEDLSHMAKYAGITVVNPFMS
jgi:predicted nucleic acid-binding protein